MIVKRVRGILVAVLVWASPSAAQLPGWAQPKCELKPGHYLVNSGILYLKDASSTRFEDQRQRDLRDAEKVLMQALSSGGQDKNPAAWYYLARYYVLQKDFAGADTAFTKAGELAPQCQEDIDTWRRLLWAPLLNAGIRAWQGGNRDSAIATFRRANQIYAGEPTGFVYLASLFADREQDDSSAKYFKLAIAAAKDSQYAKERKDAMFNLARVYHRSRHWDDAIAAYHEYLAAWPHDAQASTGLAAIYGTTGKSDSALALYTQIVEHADSASSFDLFYSGQEIFRAIPHAPDTAAQGDKCRAEARKDKKLSLRQVAARCDAETSKAMREYVGSVAAQYRLVARAYEAGLAKNPYYRDALFTLAGTYYLMSDTTRSVATAQRAYAVDPLNQSTLRMLAQTWQLRGKTDSTLQYLRIADSLLPVDVTIGNFTPEDSSAVANVVVTNFHDKPSAPLGLVFEFLNAQGRPVATQTQDVPAIDPGGNKSYALKGAGPGILAWRYKKS